MAILCKFLRPAWLLLSLLLAWPAAAQLKPIRIGWVYAMANAPVLIAEEKGFFRQHGVDVEVRRFDSGPLVMEALKAGDLDLAYVGMPPVYHAYQKGMDIKIIAKVNYGQAAVIVSRDSAIDSLAGLKGKRIAGIRKGSGMDVLLRGFVLREQAGLEPGVDVEIVHMHARMMEASVSRKIVDAAFTWEPYVSIAEMHHQARIVFDMNQAVPRYPWFVVVGRVAALQQHRSEVQKILQAHEQAIGYLDSNHETSNAIIAREFQVQSILDAGGSGLSAAEVIRRARQRTGWASEFTRSDQRFLQKLMDYSHQLGYLQTKLDAQDFIDDSIKF